MGDQSAVQLKPPTRAAQSTPKRASVGNRHFVCPGSGVCVTVHVATIGATASRKRIFRLSFALRAFLVAPIGSHRRPTGHRRRKRRREILEIAVAMYRLAAE